MRVALFTETFLPKVDGIVRVVCLLLDHLNKRGIEAKVFTPQLGDKPIADYQGIPVVSVEGVPLPWYPELRVSPPSPTVYRELREFQPDVAHFVHPVSVGLPGLVMAKQLGVPTLTSFHLDLARMTEHFNYGPVNLGFIRPFADFVTKRVFNWADYSLAPSESVRQEMLQLGIENVGLWKRGVDDQTFHPDYYSDTMRHRLSAGNPDDTLLLFVGRLSKEKKIHDLRPVLDAMPNARLAIVGEGPYRDELETVFAGTNTHFTGFLSGEELSQAYASADIFTFPSALETFGLVAVEAMASGLPVVGSRVGGIADVVTEGVNGYTFDIGDVPTLIDGVQKIARSRENIERMGHNARDFAETQTWDAMMDDVIDVYASLIEQSVVVQSA